MEQEIHLLDPCPSSGRQRNRKGSMGRKGRGTSSQCLGNITVDEREQLALLPSSSISSNPTSNDHQHAVDDLFSHSISRDSIDIPLYDSLDDLPLGMHEDASSDESQIHDKRCFNCGSPQHVVTTCPEPLHHELIALTRGLYYFFKDRAPAAAYGRLREGSKSWRIQRLQWLETFEPGQVRGDLLRQALNLEHDDPGIRVEWLRNIARWGYPRGWVGRIDPRETARNIISGNLNDQDERALDDEDCMIIFGENEEETVLLSPSANRLHTNADDITSATSLPAHENDALSILPPVYSTNSVNLGTRRWATYPQTYFLSSALPVCSGFGLPPLNSSLLTSRDARMLTAGVPPLLGHNVSNTAAFTSQAWMQQPPPPASTPPPLPPSSREEEESDMDLSD